MSAASKQPASEVDNDTIEARYIYDELGNRILGIDDTQVLKKYQYDDKGRLTAITPIDPSGDNRKINAQSIAYDAAGLPTEYGDYQLSYTAGQLSHVKDKSGSSLPNIAIMTKGNASKRPSIKKTTNHLSHQRPAIISMKIASSSMSWTVRQYCSSLRLYW